jgi:5-methyltetrahydrofolate--homocysteine methyltransferase
MTEGKKAEILESGGEKVVEIYQEVEEVKKFYKDHFKAKAVFQFFKANSEGNSINIYNGDQIIPLKSFTFPRQGKEEGLCLSDYVSPKNENLPAKDSLGFFVVTVGEGIRELAEKLKIKGEYLKSHIVSALAIESAEAYAEYLHQRMRSFWSLPDNMDITNMELFQAKYSGKRYSFGYPACPSLDDQLGLFELLGPQNDIDCTLTEDMMMEPEASVSAIVFHHPQAGYFSVGDREYMASL